MGGVQEKQVPFDCAQGGSLSRNSCRPLKRTRRFPLSPSPHSRARLSHIAAARLRLDSRHRSDWERSFVTASEALHFAPLRSGGQDRHRCIVLKQRREGSGESLSRTRPWNPTLAKNARMGHPAFVESHPCAQNAQEWGTPLSKKVRPLKSGPCTPLAWLRSGRVDKLYCSSLAACGPLPQYHFPGTAGWRRCRLRLRPNRRRRSAA